MPAFVLAYCKRPVAVTPAELLAELEPALLVTLAESLNLPEGEVAAVEELKRHLRIDPDLTIHWHATQVPIRLTIGPPNPGELAEMLDDLIPDTPDARLVREHLAATTTVASFVMGIEGSNHLAATISELLAFFIAERGDGIVWFYFREFASPACRSATLLQTQR